MASIFTDQGIDTIFGIFPKNGANHATLYLGLFTSQTATTVPDRDATGWTEAAGAAYARQPIAAADWGAPVTTSTGRKITAAQVAFPVAGSGGWGLVNGFFLATGDDTLIYFANFDDETAVRINAGDRIYITPSMTLLGAV